MKRSSLVFLGEIATHLLGVRMYEMSANEFPFLNRDLGRPLERIFSIGLDHSPVKEEISSDQVFPQEGEADDE